MLEIADGDRPGYLLYLIDSHSSLKVGYDHVHQNQIDWYRGVRDSYEKQYGHTIPSVVIQHIPVCEVFDLLTQVKKVHQRRGTGLPHPRQGVVCTKQKAGRQSGLYERVPRRSSGEQRRV